MHRAVALAFVLVGCHNAGSPPTDAAVTPMSSSSSPPPPSASAPPAPSAASETSATLGLPAEWAALPIASKTGIVRGPTEGKVENGEVFEVARVPLAAQVREVLVPAGAKIVKAKEEGTLYVATMKRLRFVGHPPEPMTLEAVRANMGCAFKVDGDTMSIGSFGEWSSKEGGASLEMVIRAPAGVRVGVMKELGGPDSRAGKGPAGARAMGHWYTSPAPTPGFERLTLEIDPRHVAARRD